jgi:hypothetical protein
MNVESAFGGSNEKRISNTDSAVVAKATMAKSAHSTAISVSFQPFDSAQGREPVERPF